MAGAMASARAIAARQQWEEANIHAGILLDWDDVQAVATRAALTVTEDSAGVLNLLMQYKQEGATHLAIPELTLLRLLDKGEVSVVPGPSAQRVYVQPQSPAVADWLVTELQARLPQLQAERSRAKTPVVSFLGDLPSVAEVGLGFDPGHADLAHQADLILVVRPIGYSWIQPEMIERTFDQAAALGAKIIAVQGKLIPGHEFKMEHTVAAMRRNRLVYAYFSDSRHQKGDWFLAKSLAGEGLVVLAHEFEPEQLLEEDWHTAAYRWATMATESGIRLCCLRFFRILHAADPLESLAYVHSLKHALEDAGLLTGHVGQVDLSPFQPQRDDGVLAWAGLSVAGAAGLAADLLPIPDELKLLGVGTGALALAGLPIWEKRKNSRLQPHEHHHDHDDPEHAHHQEHDHPHEHEHDHHHDHEHDHPHDQAHDHDHDHEHDHGHSHGPAPATAYAPKGLALAATVAYPAAAIALNGSDPLSALAQALVTGAAGAATLSATTAESDYVLGVERYRGYNLDWLIPLGLAAVSRWLGSSLQTSATMAQPLAWLPVAGLAVAAWRSWSGQGDLAAGLDREHRHAHTHHLSAFQRNLGDTKMALSPKPLRKWALLAPLGVVAATVLRRRRQDDWAAVALTAAAAGQVATLAGFRNGQRPLLKTLQGRARGWTIGVILAGIVWLLLSLFKKES